MNLENHHVTSSGEEKATATSWHHWRAPWFLRTMTYLVWCIRLPLCGPNPLLCFRKAAARNHDQKLSGFHWNCKTSVWVPYTLPCPLRSWCTAALSLDGSWSASSKAYVLSHPYFIPSGCASVLPGTDDTQGSTLIGLSAKIKGLHNVSVTFIKARTTLHPSQSGKWRKVILSSI